MLMPSIFGEDLFDDFMGYPTGRQAAANAYPQVKDMMKTDIRDVDGNYELEIDLPGFRERGCEDPAEEWLSEHSGNQRREEGREG